MQPFSGGAQEWNRLVASLPEPHLLQTWEWAQVKARYGWQSSPFVWPAGNGKVRAAAMLLQRSLPLRGFAARLRVLYVPKGPLLDWSQAALRGEVLEDLQRFARRRGAIFLKIDPDVRLGTGVPGTAEADEDRAGQEVRSDLVRRGWVFSGEQVQFRNTVLLDLRPSEEELLAGMKPKTRYNIRLAERKGVRVRPAGEAELAALYAMYAETSGRDGFAIRARDYYLAVWETFLRSVDPHLEPLVAEVDGEPVAALFLFRFAGRAYYLYGMSRAAHREKMPNHLLQWEAVRRARQAGCTVYDLWGAPDDFSGTDPLAGVFRFKDGFGGRVVRTLGAWDYPCGGFWYPVYTRVLPRILAMMRWRGRGRTLRSLGA
jgi:peptidoglycan pentaglycine glycine transferase (the first glycine)